MMWGPCSLLHSLPYEILGLLRSVSSSSSAFFFLLPGLAPFAVGWLDSRVGNDDTGVAAWDGVVPAEAGVEASCDAQSAQVPQCSEVQCSAGCYCCYCCCYCCQPAGPSTYPQEARGAATEDAVRVADLGFAACRCARSAGGCGGRRALDVVVEAFDDVPGAGLFQVLRLDSQDVVFELLLRIESAPG
jgi:hypothetical protein